LQNVNPFTNEQHLKQLDITQTTVYIDINLNISFIKCMGKLFFALQVGLTEIAKISMISDPLI